MRDTFAVVQSPVAAKRNVQRRRSKTQHVDAICSTAGPPADTAAACCTCIVHTSRVPRQHERAHRRCRQRPKQPLSAPPGGRADAVRPPPCAHGSTVWRIHLHWCQLLIALMFCRRIQAGMLGGSRDSVVLHGKWSQIQLDSMLAMLSCGRMQAADTTFQ